MFLNQPHPNFFWRGRILFSSGQEAGIDFLAYTTVETDFSFHSGTTECDRVRSFSFALVSDRISFWFQSEVSFSARSRLSFMGDKNMILSSV